MAGLFFAKRKLKLLPARDARIRRVIAHSATTAQRGGIRGGCNAVPCESISLRPNFNCLLTRDFPRRVA
jgi:hypothetical protein